MRERKDYCDLERVRHAQCEQFKQTQLRCKQLELDNNELKNNLYLLEKEKMEQAEKIKELQREIDRLRNEKVKQIQYKNDHLNQKFSKREKILFIIILINKYLFNYFVNYLYSIFIFFCKKTICSINNFEFSSSNS